jgi:sugar phosphate isomerase/epimerase
VYKILNSRGLGVAGKQNELIELALTHGFNGVEVDMVDLVGRHDTLGKEFACQFLQSAKIDLGTFRLPINLGAPEEQYTASISKLDTILDLAKTLNAKCCYVEILANSGHFAFQENFQKHQNRLQELSEKFAGSSVRIGLALKRAVAKPSENDFKFIQNTDELLTLVKAVGQENVGICLDSWEWVVNGGTIEQLTAPGVADLITELRLADVAEGADLKSIKPSERTALPGDAADSFTVKLCKAILAGGREIPISVSTDLSTFADGARDSIVGKLSRQLDLLIAGKDPAAILQAQEDAIAAEAADDSDGTEVEEPVAAATE